MPRTVTMQRYRFAEGIWKNAIRSEADTERLGRAFPRNRLFGEEGRQLGFINCLYANGIVFGYYAQEGTKEIIDYDANVRARTGTVNSFAHILFALHVASGLVALQNTRIAGYVDLNLSDMRTRFPTAVEELMRELQLPIIRLFLEHDRTEITSEMLYRIFTLYKTTELNVVNLKGRSVPSYEEFKIFNPRVEQDKIFRQIFEEDIQSGLDNLTLQTPETDDLKKTALARLSARVGDIKSLVVDPQDNGQGIKITTSVPDKFQATLSSEDEKQPVSHADISAISQSLTLTLTLQGGDVSKFLNNILLLNNPADKRNDGDA